MNMSRLLLMQTARNPSRHVKHNSNAQLTTKGISDSCRAIIVGIGVALTLAFDRQASPFSGDTSKDISNFRSPPGNAWMLSASKHIFSYTRRHAKQGFEIYHLKPVEGRMEAMLFSRNFQNWKFL